MKVSFNWLKQYINLPDSVAPEEVALKLTMSTVEVEKVEKQGEFLDGVVVGKVVSVGKHPNANKLKVCRVDDSSGKIQVVCGGSNLREGMLVALAKVGAKVRWHGEGELTELKETEIRGVMSSGMICASTEIGLEEMFPLKDEKEILDLTNLTPPYKGEGIVGQSLAEALGLNDTVFDIDNKSMTHRPDLWGHYGLAREVAALYNKKLEDLKIEKLEESKKADLKIKIEDKENCARYIGAVVGRIKIAPSPAWMQNHLRACGVRPINNIVDITNYVTLELGRPSHAFDRRDIAEDTIIVRRAKDKEKFTTLDGQSRIMTDKMCLVCDAKRAVDLGGIMGGENSEVKNDTAEIILELANFNPANIRRTSMALGLRTEAGMRFEKGISPYLAEVGMKRILTLIKQLIPGARLLSKIVDVDYTPKENREIELDFDFINKKIGQEIPKKEAIKILIGLGFAPRDKKDKLSVTVPQWRSVKDISIPEDLVEEVARVYGYGNIKTQLPVFPVIPPERNELRSLERKIKEILALEFGFTEVCNYSFVSPDVLAKIGEDMSQHLELANPISKDRPFLRRHLLPNMLINAEANLHRFDEVKIFEIGKVFHGESPGQRVSENSDELLPRQNTLLSLVYAKKGDEAPFYTASEAVQGVLFRLGLKIDLKKAVHPRLVHDGRFAELSAADVKIGFVGEVDLAAQKCLGIDEKVGVAEIDLNVLLGLVQDKSTYRPPSVYPEVARDIAFVVDKKIEHAKIVEKLKKADKLIVNAELFDVFEGKNLGSGKKSMAYHIIYQSSNRTLISQEVDKAHAGVVKIIEKEFGGEVRK